MFISLVGTVFLFFGPVLGRLALNDPEISSQHSVNLLIEGRIGDAQGSKSAQNARNISAALGVQRRGLNGNNYAIHGSCSPCNNPITGYCQGGRFGTCFPGFPNPVIPQDPRCFAADTLQNPSFEGPIGRRPINSHLATLEHWRVFPSNPVADQDIFFHLFTDKYFPDQMSGEYWWGSSLQAMIPPNPNQNGAGLSQLINVCPGAKYTFSFWYLPDANAVNCQIYYGFSQYQLGEAPNNASMAAQGQVLANHAPATASTNPAQFNGWVKLESNPTTMASNGTYLEVFVKCPTGAVNQLTTILLDSFQLHPR